MFAISEDEVYRHKMTRLTDEIRRLIDATINKTCLEILCSDFVQQYNVDSNCDSIRCTLMLSFKRAIEILYDAAPHDVKTLYNVKNFVILNHGVLHNPFISLRHVHNVLDSQSVPGDLIIKFDPLCGWSIYGTVISKDLSDPASGWIYAHEKRLPDEPRAIWSLTACEVIYTMSYPHEIHSIIVDTNQ